MGMEIKERRKKFLWHLNIFILPQIQLFCKKCHRIKDCEMNETTQAILRREKIMKKEQEETPKIQFFSHEWHFSAFAVTRWMLIEVRTMGVYYVCLIKLGHDCKQEWIHKSDNNKDEGIRNWLQTAPWHITHDRSYTSLKFKQ